jgi:hypothetical protein
MKITIMVNFLFFLAKKMDAKSNHPKIYIKKERQIYKWRGHKPKAPLTITKSKIRYT